MAKQTLLPIELTREQRLSNFVIGANHELMAALTAPHGGFRGIWLYGDVSSGRTHLLRSRCRDARGETAQYIGCTDFGEDVESLREALRNAARHGDVVAVDDVERILGERALEELLLAIYQRLIGSAGMLVVSHFESSLLTSFALPDLGSRMRAMMNFALKPLDDEQKADLLKQRAKARGFALDESVVKYWLARGPRDMGALLEDLEALDRATLQTKRRLTVPLLKEVLGY